MEIFCWRYRVEYFIEHISRKVINELRELINADFYGIDHSMVDIHPLTNSYYFYHHLGMSYRKGNKSGYVNITIQHIESIDKMLGYKLDVIIQNKLLDESLYEYGLLTKPPVTLYFGNPLRITKIEIYHFSKFDDEAAINYDALVLFYSKEDYILAFKCPGDYSERIEFKIIKRQDLDKMTEGLDIRVVIE